MKPTTSEQPKALPSPIAVVRQRICRPGSFTPNQRLVALEIAARLNRDTRSWAIPYSELAEATGLSLSTVQRCVNVLCDGDEPQFARRAWGKASPTRRRIYEFRLVENVLVFAAARRRENAEHARAVEHDLAGFVEQTKRENARDWGAGEISDGDYRERERNVVAEFERRAAKGRFQPRRRRRKRLDPTGDIPL